MRACGLLKVFLPIQLGTIAVVFLWTSAPFANGGEDTSTRPGQGDKSMKLFDFQDPQATRLFRPINDTVMGGSSSSEFVPSGSGTGLFRGKVSLENNGGFASVRSPAEDRDLSGYTGIRVRLRGDGKKYRLHLSTDRSFDGIAYRSDFKTHGGDWETLDFPFADMLPSYHGDILRDRPAIDPSKVQTFGFLIADVQEGAFCLEIANIEAYRAEETRKE